MPSLVTFRSRKRGAAALLATALGTALLAAVILLVGPLNGRASAQTLPIVFPLESRVPVARMFLAPRDGHLHQGIDLLAPKMTKEMAAVSGTVTLQVRMYNGLPWYTLWLAGDDGHGYYYSHINNDTPGTDDGHGGLRYAFAPRVVTGTHVTKGQFIAYCGDSGNAESSAPHLHFEIHETIDMSSPAVDPYDSLYRAPRANGTPGPAWPVPHLTLYEQTNLNIAYTGSWTTFIAAGASGGSYKYADSKAAALIWFQGTRLDLLATTAVSGGKAWLSLDGAPASLVSFYSSTTLRKQVVWSSGPLGQGTHTIRLEWAGQASAVGGGTRIDIDALQVTGNLVQAPSVVSLQQTNSLLSYKGTWNTSYSASASGGSFRYANSSGASVTAQFEGMYAAWVAKKSPVYGLARLTLDNDPPVTVDLYSASALYQQRVWNSGILPYGVHTVKIEWLGVKNGAASGTNISLDALQLIGGLDKVGSAVWTGPTAGTTILP